MRASSLHLPLSPRTSCSLLCSAARLTRSLASFFQSAAHSRAATAPSDTISADVRFIAPLPPHGSLVAGGDLFLLQPVELGVCPKEQAAAGDGRCGPGEVAEGVLADDLELVAVLHDPGRAVLVEQKHLAVVGPRR